MVVGLWKWEMEFTQVAKCEKSEIHSCSQHNRVPLSKESNRLDFSARKMTWSNQSPTDTTAHGFCNDAIKLHGRRCSIPSPLRGSIIICEYSLMIWEWWEASKDGSMDAKLNMFSWRA